jgi:predicted TIM-barrel enzyme
VVPHDWPHAEVSVPAAISAGPCAASAGASAIRRFALSGVPLSVSGVVEVVGHHYLRHQNHWECCVSVRLSEKLSFH